MVSSPIQQRGVALLMAVVAVAIIALIALGMATQQSVTLKRVQNTLWFDQAQQYLLSGEQLVAQTLQEDLLTEQKRNKPYDFDELFLKKAFSFPIPSGSGGMIGGNINDAQGKFNLRNLLQENGGQDLKATPAFDRLLTALKLDKKLTDSVMDWMDADKDRLPNGAEDDFYLVQERPRLTANQPLVSIHELREIKGFDELITQPDGSKKTAFEVLKNHIVLLPTRTALNVNLASEEVLQSYLPHIEGDKINEVVNNRPYKSVDEFKALSVHKTRRGKAKFELLPDFSVRSDYFVVNLDVSLGNITAAMQSILKRKPKEGTVQVVSRLRSPA